MNFNTLILQDLWCETFGWNKYDSKDRRFNDDIEHIFWDKLAPIYTNAYNLNDDTSLIRKRIAEIIGVNKKVLEIGCGTGNFTLFMSEYSAEIMALDFSPAMLNELRKRLKEKNLKNVLLKEGKWEEYAPEEKYDYIVSINSLYRIKNMEESLLKIYNNCRQGFIIVRTIQRPFFYKIYSNLGININECNDYQLMALMLWKNKVRANIEYLTYSKKKTYKTINAVLEEMILDLGTEVFLAHKEHLVEEIRRNSKQVDEGVIISQERITAIIYLNKISG